MKFQSVLPTLGLSTLLLVPATALAQGNGEEKVDICHVTGSAKNPTVSIRVGMPALDAHMAHGDSMGPCADCDNEIPDDVERCGGIAGFRCSDPSAVCVDDPRDDCDPAAGGRDCFGICVIPLTNPTPDDCPAPGYVWVDDAFDDCNPDCDADGDGMPDNTDCRLICVATAGDRCGGFAGDVCPRGPFMDCVDSLGDLCTTDSGTCAAAGADCGGLCVDVTSHPPMTCDADGCCPPGAVCMTAPDGTSFCVVPSPGDTDGGGDDDSDA